MIELVLAASTALWLGILTSISPCPLATNIAAISYIGRRVGSPRAVLLTGLLYTLGRMLTYLVLALILVHALLSAPQLSVFLQKYMYVLVGPLLILMAMFLLGLIELPQTRGFSTLWSQRVDNLGVWGGLLLGVLFALAFCPTSAALFFGSVMNAVGAGSTWLLPLLYGLGTALPVLFFALLITTGSQRLGQAFNVTTQVEWWARHLTGLTLLSVGLYLTFRHIFLA